MIGVDVYADTQRPHALPVLKQCPRCASCFTHDEWDRLELVGEMPDGDGGRLVLKNCPCGSTISIPVGA